MPQSKITGRFVSKEVAEKHARWVDKYGKENARIRMEKGRKKLKKVLEKRSFGPKPDPDPEPQKKLKKIGELEGKKKDPLPRAEYTTEELKYLYETEQREQPETYDKWYGRMRREEEAAARPVKKSFLSNIMSYKGTEYEFEGEVDSRAQQLLKRVKEAGRTARLRVIEVADTAMAKAGRLKVIAAEEGPKFLTLAKTKSLEFLGEAAYIVILMIDAIYRGGIKGKKMMKKIIAMAKELKIPKLELIKDSALAREMAKSKLSLVILATLLGIVGVSGMIVLIRNKKRLRENRRHLHKGKLYTRHGKKIRSVKMFNREASKELFGKSHPAVEKYIDATTK